MGQMYNNTLAQHCQPIIGAIFHFLFWQLQKRDAYIIIEAVMKMSFSKKLADAMKEKKISTRTLSEMTGVPKSAIQRYTSGETEKIPIDRMKLMAKALGIDPAYVMGWDEVSSVPGSESPAAQKLRVIGKELSRPSDPRESELVDLFQRLNDGGKEALLSSARGMAANPAMCQDGASSGSRTV